MEYAHLKNISLWDDKAHYLLGYGNTDNNCYYFQNPCILNLVFSSQTLQSAGLLFNNMSSSIKKYFFYHFLNSLKVYFFQVDPTARGLQSCKVSGNSNFKFCSQLNNTLETLLMNK